MSTKKIDLIEQKTNLLLKKIVEAELKIKNYSSLLDKNTNVASRIKEDLNEFNVTHDALLIKIKDLENSLKIKDKELTKISSELDKSLFKEKFILDEHHKLKKENEKNIENSNLFRDSLNQAKLESQSEYQKLKDKYERKIVKIQDKNEQIIQKINKEISEKNNHIDNLQIQIYQLNTYKTENEKKLSYFIKIFIFKWVQRIIHPLRSSRNLYRKLNSIINIKRPIDFLDDIGAYKHIKKINRRLYFKKDMVNNYKPELIKTICFYLPQFHAIKENDDWWGSGFTEWTNVKKASKQYDYHYQPRIPDNDLGYYDLSNGEVMQKQAELAKKYGVHGFCFYHYWFDAKRLLEKPVDTLLKNKDIDMPFCLCWANENWTRVWDGSEDDVLIAQKHSDEDDILFIKDLSRYFSDKRYITVDGRPLIIIYRPSLLPDIKKTSHRWREWCRKEGFGEIYLAYTQSFDNQDPSEYGLDAAIEFPPNNANITNITDKIKTVSGFDGQIWDWNELYERSTKVRPKKYKFFQAANPGWDNTPRKGKNASIVIGNSPLKFTNYIKNICQHTLKNPLLSKNEKFIFINAWNEWAEGAYLEPDKVYGYSYLNSLKQGLLSAEASTINKTKFSSKIAVVIHAFYPEILQSYLELLDQNDQKSNLKIYISTTKEKLSEVKRILSDFDFECIIKTYRNKGRDVLPFLKILEHVKKDNIRYLIKIHTKKTTHRKDGDQWRSQLISKLISPEYFNKNIRKITNKKNKIGMIGPENHVVPMETYLGNNKELVFEISSRIGMSEDEVLKVPYAAGTMFICDLVALEPIIQLGLDESDFEEEEGQVDGTIMHALERVLAVSVKSTQLNIVTTDSITSNPVINNNYGYAEKS